MGGGDATAEDDTIKVGIGAAASWLLFNLGLVRFSKY